MIMNEIKEIINVSEITKSCRHLDPTELLNLLKADFWKFASWGASGFTIDSKANTKMFRMKVNGHKHKGHVYIFVNSCDLFDVYLTTVKGVIKQKNEEGLYFDMLFDWIDERIEKIPEYIN